MKKFLFLILLLILIPLKVNATNNINIYYFHGDGCPNCAHMDTYLDNLKDEYKNITIKEYEVWYNNENQTLMNNVKKAITDKNISGIPFVAIGNKYTVGYSESITSRINTIVNDYSNGDYDDYVGKFINNEISEIPQSVDSSSIENIPVPTATPNNLKKSTVDYKMIATVILIVIILIISILLAWKGYKKHD